MNLENSGIDYQKYLHQESLLREVEEDFADVAYHFYQLFAQIYPQFPLPNSLDFVEVAKYLDPRKGGALEYGQEEKVNETESAQLVFAAAEKLGLVKKEIVSARNEIESRLKIYAEPIAYDKEVEAAVVLGGAGETFIKRMYHALEAIKTEKVKTSRIILLAGERKVAQRENDLLQKDGYTAGETEFDLAKGAVIDLTKENWGKIGEEKRNVVLGKDNYEMDLISGKITLETGKVVEVTIINSPYDKKRTLKDGTLANRATTEETFVALNEILTGFNTDKTLYLVSHDIWQPAQMLFAQETIGKDKGRRIIGSGPKNIDRVKMDEEGNWQLSDPGAVLSEINKYFNIVQRFYETLKQEDD